MTDPLYPLRFEPVYKRYIWGGRRLATVLGKAITAEQSVAESWEIADHRDGMSVVAEGPLRGTTLHELMERHGASILGHSGNVGGFPLLVKFLDAGQALSVQVHPDDVLAEQIVNDRGKTEAWVVLYREPGSVLYAGLKHSLTREELRHAFLSGEIERYLHGFEPRVGDCVFLPAGTVHALGAGIVVAEVQQASNATFRIHDWGRAGPDGRPRDLHLAEALQAIDPNQGAIGPVRSRLQMRAWGQQERLVNCPHFVLERWSLDHPARVGSREGFTILIGIMGVAEVTHGGHIYGVGRGETLLLPAALGECKIVPCPHAIVLHCTPCESERA